MQGVDGPRDVNNPANGPSSLESKRMLILASASPRRQELLRNARIPFVAQAADIEERIREGELARDCAERLAREKAIAVSQSRPADCILGADTIVVVDGSILGKPRDAADATRMLRMLSGRDHEVITGVCVLGAVASGQGSGASKDKTQTARSVGEQLTTGGRRVETASNITIVTMSELSDEDIHEYIATGEPMDKAGAYAIQGIASRWISRIEGDYSNVVGLPVALVYGMLREQGVL